MVSFMLVLCLPSAFVLRRSIQLSVFSVPSSADKFGLSSVPSLGATVFGRRIIGPGIPQDSMTAFLSPGFEICWVWTCSKPFHSSFWFIFPNCCGMVSVVLRYGTYSRASPFSLIPISVLFVITLGCFVLICSPTSVLSLPLAERMIALQRQEWLRESGSMLLYSTLSVLFVGNCNLHFLKFQQQHFGKIRGYKSRTSPSKSWRTHFLLASKYIYIYIYIYICVCVCVCVYVCVCVLLSVERASLDQLNFHNSTFQITEGRQNLHEQC